MDKWRTVPRNRPVGGKSVHQSVGVCQLLLPRHRQHGCSHRAESSPQPQPNMLAFAQKPLAGLSKFQETLCYKTVLWLSIFFHQLYIGKVNTEVCCIYIWIAKVKETSAYIPGPEVHHHGECGLQHEFQTYWVAIGSFQVLPVLTPPVHIGQKTHLSIERSLIIPEYPDE